MWVCRNNQAKVRIKKIHAGNHGNESESQEAVGCFLRYRDRSACMI